MIKWRFDGFENQIIWHLKSVQLPKLEGVNTKITELQKLVDYLDLRVVYSISIFKEIHPK